MARNRMIKPEFWEDEVIAELGALARLLFIALWNFADDDGYLKYSPKWLKAKCLPYDNIDITVLIKELIDCGRLRLNNNILFIVNFTKHQYINRPRCSDLKYLYHNIDPKSEKVKSDKLDDILYANRYTVSPQVDTKIASKNNNSRNNHGIINEDSLNSHGAIREPSGTKIEIERRKEDDKDQYKPPNGTFTQKRPPVGGVVVGFEKFGGEENVRKTLSRWLKTSKMQKDSRKPYALKTDALKILGGENLAAAEDKWEEINTTIDEHEAEVEKENLKQTQEKLAFEHAEAHFYKLHHEVRQRLIEIARKALGNDPPPTACKQQAIMDFMSLGRELGYENYIAELEQKVVSV